METESCELYLAPGIDGREESKQRSMVVNLKIMEARNIVAKPGGGKRATMFVRYHLRAGDGYGEGNNVAVNTREVLATPDPQWKQTFCLECRGNLCDLQKQFVMFELRQRSRIRILGMSMFRSSKVVGWVEIPWKELLASPTLSISSSFPLLCNDTSTLIGSGSQLPPSLLLAISVNPSNTVNSDSRPPHQHLMEMHERKRFPRISKTRVADETSWGVGSDQEVMVWKIESSRNGNMNMNVNRRIRRLER